ncbi:MAG: hypothetical protein PVI90_16235 [Desulfobacteraceae bacterium]|jgi:hypothetical protein
MDWIEIIQLRPYTQQDRVNMIQAFKQLFIHQNFEGLIKIILFQGISLENDLSIHIHWHGSTSINGKSGLGRQLVNSFLEFGQIYHSGWMLMKEHNVKKREFF